MKIVNVKKIAVSVLILFLATFSLARDPIAVAEITSGNAFSANVTALAQMVNVPFLAMGVNAWLSNVTHCPNMAGVDMNKPIKFVVWLDDDGKGIGFTVVTSIVDAGETLGTAFKAVHGKTEETEGILALQEAKLPGAIKLNVAFVDNLAVIGEERKFVADTVTAIKNKKLPSVAAISGTVKVSINIPEVVPWADKSLTEIVNDLAGMTEGRAVDQKAMAVDTLKQIKELSLGLSIDVSGLTVYSRIDPIANTKIAEFFSKFTPVDQRYSRLLPEKSLFAFSFTGMDAADLFTEFYMKSFENAADDLGLGKAEMSAYIKSFNEAMKNQYAGACAGSLASTGNGSQLELVEIFAIKDEAITRAVVYNSQTNASAIFRQPGLQEHLKGAKIQIEPAKSRVHEGVEIFPVKYVFVLPDDKRKEVPAPLLQFLENLSYEYATVNGHLVTVFGVQDGTTKTMEKTVDKLKNFATITDGSKICKLFPEMVAVDPVGEWQVSLSDFLIYIGKLSGKLTPEIMAMLPPQTGEGLGAINLRKGEALFGALRLSASEIKWLTQASAAGRQAIIGNQVPNRNQNNNVPAIEVPPHMQ